MKQNRDGSQRGYALIVAVVSMLVLTVIAMRVMQAVTVDIDLAGHDRTAQDALYIADAGIAWGVDRLRQAPFNLDLATDLNAAFDGGLAPPITGGDGCPDAACPIFGWYGLTSGPQSFGGGSYWVAVRDDDEADGDPSVDSNNRILIRSLAAGAGGARRLVEAALTLQ